MTIQPLAASTTDFSRPVEKETFGRRPAPPQEALKFWRDTFEVSTRTVARKLLGKRAVYRPALKRAKDVVGASALLLVLAPLLLLLFTLVRMDGGPAIYRHKRLGRGGRPFDCLKFRTMRSDSDEVLAKLLANDPERAREWREGFKLRDDPRVTRVGRILRQTSLDELPQLINVIRGEMSLVGWRPMPRDEFRVYAKSLTRKELSGIRGL